MVDDWKILACGERYMCDSQIPRKIGEEICVPWRLVRAVIHFFFEEVAEIVKRDGECAIWKFGRFIIIDRGMGKVASSLPGRQGFRLISVRSRSVTFKPCSDVRKLLNQPLED